MLNPGGFRSSNQMKRQHWSTQSEDDEEEGRAAKAARSRDEEAGQFDLNATPRGFDLNAPFSEEDDGQGSEWMEEKAPESDEQHKEPEESVPSILKQQFEPAASLGIDEDLDVLHNIWNAKRDSERDEILSNLCEEIGKHPSGFPRYQYLACCYLSKKVPSAFSLPRTYKVLLSFLDSNVPAVPNKKQSFLPIFASRLLLRAFWEEPEWPLDFVKLYLEDAVNGRTWIDNEHCKDFVLNVLTAFREDDHDIIFGDELQSYGSETLPSGKGDASSTDRQAAVKNRYPQDELRQKARQEFLESLHQLIKAPSSKESPRTLIRLIMLGICYEEVRVLASSMLEGWLNTPVHFRAAKVLLDRLIHHTHTTSPSDLETVANLLSCRLSPQGVGQIKTSVSNIHTDIVFQLVQRRPEYSSHALKTFLTAELASKGSHNIKGISVVLKALPDSQSPDRELALAIKKLTANEENAGRLQDVVLRLTKQLSREVSPFLLSRALFEPWAPVEAKEEGVKEAWFRQIVDLVCKLLIQAAIPFGSDENFVLAISSASQSEPPKEKMLQLEAFSVKVMTFQIEALTWCTEVLNVSLPEMVPSRFASMVRKLLFLEKLQEYSLSTSNSDTELNCFQLVSYCMHASEEILARIILMGIAHQFPMVPEDALSIIESLVWRAASSRNHIYGTLFADNNQLPAAIMKLSSFNLPVTQQPLQIVFKDMYWRSCFIILVISVYNPATIGRSVWESSSPLRCLLQALATGTICSSQDELNSNEALEQDSKVEETIKSLLADNEPVVPSEEQWKGNVMLLSPEVKPPKYVMEELGKIDADYHLGRKIRACKNPNYLTDTVRSQEFSQAWRWVKKVVLKEPEIVGMFPCSWQSELLYMYQRTKSHSPEVLAQLQDIRTNVRKVIEENSNSEEIERVVKFLCEKIMSPSYNVRSAACSCALLLFGSRSAVEFIEGRPNSESTESSWLNGIDKLKAAPEMLKIITPALQNALLYESSLHTILSYLLFLRRQLPTRSFCCSVARLLVGRKVICASVLQMPVNDTKSEDFQVADLFLESFNKAFEDTSPDWDEANAPGVDIAGSKVPAFVVEALLVILAFTASQENDNSRKKPSYCCLLQTLFPEADGSGLEQSFFLTEVQAVQLARTKDSRLVKAGLSVLGLDKKIQLLKDLGLPVEAKACLYEELEVLPDKSLESFLLLPLCERLRLSSCFTTLKTDMENSRFVKVLRSSVDDTPEMDLDEPVDERSVGVQEQSAEELCQSALKGLFPQTDDQSCSAITTNAYVPFRVLLQKAVITKNTETIRDVLTSIVSTQAGAQVKLLLLLLPVLTILSEAGTSFSEIASSLLKVMPRVDTTGPLSAAALERIEHLGKRLTEKLEESANIPPEQPLQKLEQSLQQYLILRLEDYLKRKDVVPFSSAVQDILSRLKQYGASLSDVEAAGRYGILVAVLSTLDPELASKEHLLPLVCTAASADAGNSLAFTSLVLEHVVHKGRAQSLYSFAEGLWDMILRRFDLKDIKATDETCIAASLLFEFLHLSTDATCLRLGASSSQVLAALAVLSCALETQDQKQRLSTAGEVLLRASLGHEAMHAILQQLTSMSQNEIELRTAAAQLLYGLYLAYPITIGSLLGCSATAALRLPASRVASESQGSGFYNFVRQAMLSVFSNSSTGASALCYYLARKHPVLLIQHLDSVKQFLQENVSQIRGGSNEQRILLGRTLVFTVELLDTVWLQLQSSEAEAESLLELLFQVLRALDTPDQPHFGKFVAQLGEFLSRRVVAGGGKCLELVRSQSREVLWPAAQKFGKAKKLAHLVQLLEQQGPSTASSSKALNELAEMSAEKTSKVRAVLSHFLHLQLESVHESWDITKDESASEFDLLATLVDLERASAHVPGLLTSMEDCIAGLMRNQNADVRELVYVLVGRSLQHNSCKPQLFTLEILEQLKTPASTSQLETLIRHLPKLFYYFEDHERDILMELFRGGKATTGCLNQIVMEALSMSTL